MEVTEEALSLHFDLASDEADLRLGGYHATTDLLLQLRAAVTGVGAAAVSAKLDLAETTLQLTDAQLDDLGDVDGPPPAWSAAFRVDQAGLVVPLSANRTAAGTMRGVLQTLSDEGFGALLQAAEGEASAVLTVPRIDWLAQRIERPMGLQLGGGGELDVHAVLSDGLPIAGSSLRIARQALAVSVLEHQVEGAGEASLMLEAGDKGPQARLTVAFDDARLHRLDEDEPSVGDVRLDAEVLVHDPFAEAMKDAAATAALSLAIRSARVPDMRTYNPYLPEHAGVAILGGEASLVGDLNVTSDSACTWICRPM